MFVTDQHLRQALRVGVGVGVRVQEVGSDAVQGLGVHPLGAADQVVRIVGTIVDLLVEHFLGTKEGGRGLVFFTPVPKRERKRETHLVAVAEGGGEVHE